MLALQGGTYSAKRICPWQVPLLPLPWMRYLPCPAFKLRWIVQMYTSSPAECSIVCLGWRLTGQLVRKLRGVYHTRALEHGGGLDDAPGLLGKETTRNVGSQGKMMSLLNGRRGWSFSCQGVAFSHLPR